MKIHDEEINKWINDCHTHKCDVNHTDEPRICFTVCFNNEPEEQAPLILTKEMEVKDGR